jgi:4-amino-4-deoxy-L-arabinose transferase-like glycosyltransferase
MRMKVRALLSRLLACAILLFAFGLTVYRARVQSIAHDEATTYQYFLDGGVYHVLFYNPANHALFTILAKPFVWFLGISEFTLRAPSLFAAAGYLIATYLLCAKLFGGTLLLPLSVALLSFNPQILDFLPAARGYSLGLACLAAAMYIFTTLLDRGDFNPDDKSWRWGCATASVLLALSVAASFTNIVPATCMTFSFSVVALGGFSAFTKFGDHRLRVLAQYLIFPGVAAGFGILWPFLIQARPAHVETNMGGAADALRDWFNASFLYKWTGDVHSSLGAVPSAPGSWPARVSDLGMYVLLPLLFCFVALGLFLALRFPAEARTKQNAQMRMYAGAAVTSVVFIFLLHVIVGINYPFSRYCLFFIPLLTIGALLTGREIYARFTRVYWKAAGLAIAAFVVFDYALSINTSYFRYNAYDVISRELFETIAKDAAPRGLTNVRVGGTWWYEPEINFYRRRYKAGWLLPYDIKDRSYFWETPNSLVPADYDYFVYLPACDPGLTGSRVRTIFHDDKTQVTIIALARR